MSRVIDGRFELVERLGGGGMGTVWRARDLALHRDVALKEVRPPDPAMAEYDTEGARTLRARVLREARALARIDHPNVVTIHHIVDAGEGTYPWLVMELVTGGSLQDRLDRGTMAPTEAAVLGRELLSALRAAHGLGIEHRDVKPANVLLRPDGRPVLTDFGIAAIRESTALTASGSIIGSPDYMAPERIRGGASGPAADLWSLAMLLYVAVEGHHPLRRENTLATLAAVISDDVPPPVRAGALTGVLTRLLVRDPATRPDAEEVDRALAAVAPGAQGDGGTVRDRVPGFGAPETGGADSGGTTSFRLAPPAAGGPAGPAGVPVAGGPAGFTGAPPATAPVAGGAPGRRGRRIVVAAAVAAVLAVGIPVAAVNWDRGADGRDDGPTAAPSQQGPGAQRPPGSAASTGAPSKEPAVEATAGKLDLLTPAGVRTAVAAVEKASGGAKVSRFVVYPEYATAEAMVEGSTTRYDRYMYRGGDVAVREGPGGTAFPGSVPVDLDTFAWDALPTLLKRAEKELGVKEPVNRYLVVSPASTLTKSDPEMSVYLSDTYGSAYLAADAKGRVTAVHPRED
ncbi:serine/threonine-protein kinase [Streptomyces bikiniensis]|uniref:serine/threonine-protein kinase n=1 Tax=Streptomyces bikiniensis TaxID=1896 RepID=UPI0022773A16|nr:serine/threonine-protein kinase [Streptomyces bikiniensis]